MHLNVAALELFLTAYFHTSPTLLRAAAFQSLASSLILFRPCHLEKAEPFRRKGTILLLRTHRPSPSQPLHCAVHQAGYHSRHRRYRLEALGINCLDTGRHSSKFTMSLKSYMNWRISSYSRTWTPTEWCWRR